MLKWYFKDNARLWYYRSYSLWYCLLECIFPQKVSIVPIKRAFPMVAFLYGMAVCCTVEINLSGMFFLGLAFVNSLKSYNNSDLNRKDLYLRNTNRLLNEN